MTIEVLKRLLEEGVKWDGGNGFDLLRSTLNEERPYYELEEVWEEQVGGWQFLKEIVTHNDFNNLNIRYIFMIDGNIYALDTHQDSFGNGDWNMESFYEVQETTKTITEWTPK